MTEGLRKMIRIVCVELPFEYWSGQYLHPSHAMKIAAIVDTSVGILEVSLTAREPGQPIDLVREALKEALKNGGDAK